MPDIINTKFLVLFLMNLELTRLPEPLDMSKVNSNIAKVIVGFPKRRISFCNNASSIRMKPMPRAAKYGIMLPMPSSSLPDLRIHAKGMTRKSATITKLV